MVNKDLVILVLTEAVYRLRVHLKHVPTVCSYMDELRVKDKNVSWTLLTAS